jgi:hypothetical protein
MLEIPDFGEMIPEVISWAEDWIDVINTDNFIWFAAAFGIILSTISWIWDQLTGTSIDSVRSSLSQREFDE